MTLFFAFQYILREMGSLNLTYALVVKVHAVHSQSVVAGLAGDRRSWIPANNV